jgi:LAO/AO transport system kinase
MSAKNGQRNTLGLQEYAAGVAQGDRATLARAITLIESSRQEHQALAQELLQQLLASTGNAIRVGITGVPGVGKSTLIDQLGTNLTAAGHKVAVLAVDPSSERSGGSILGDKTRMPRLAQDDNAFIRPSPTSGTLGGVTKTTRETMALCEAAGFDILLIETVGVGQSETAVAGMVDFFLVLMLPGAGDELQGIKKGVIEIADMIAVTKSDGDNVQRAELAASEYRAALQILTPVSPNWPPPVITVSARENSGIGGLWDLVEQHRAKFTKSGELETKRQDQAVRWMHDMLEERLRARLRSDKTVNRRMSELEKEVRLGQVAPSLAVEEIVELVGMKPAAKKSE